jgi:predicted ferric reductase
VADEELFTHRYRHYIWATAAVYFTSVLIRFAVMLNRNGRHIARGHIEVLPDNAVRVTARLPRDSGHAWSAGQHYFVNFIKARPFESHPYTIANAPWRDPSSSVSRFSQRTLLRSLENPLAECQLPCSQETPDKLVLLFRVSPTKGLGPRLLSLANSSSPSTPLLLDGPYGGLAAYNRDFSRHDVVILIAGGAGISACTSVLEELGGRIVRNEPGVRTTRIMLWWMVRDESESN